VSHRLRRGGHGGSVLFDEIHCRLLASLRLKLGEVILNIRELLSEHLNRVLKLLEFAPVGHVSSLLNGLKVRELLLRQLLLIKPPPVPRPRKEPTKPSEVEEPSAVMEPTHVTSKSATHVSAKSATHAAAPAAASTTAHSTHSASSDACHD